jgi:phthiodiolone/phenolphthiodiolone dimycocerosates ketoreductase
MKVGIRVPPAPPFDRMRRLISRLRAGGVDSFWWADHLMAFGSPALWGESRGAPDLSALHSYADPFVCMAACANETGEADVGTCVTDAVRRMPATILQSALSVDHLVSGRVLIGLGAGEAANYRPYGWNVSSPAGRLEEAAHSIRRLLDHPEPDASGAIMGLRPRSTSAGPELWLAAHGPRGLALTGQLADGWIPTNLALERWLSGRAAVRVAALESGRSADDVQMGLSLDVVVQDSHEQAHEILRHPAVRMMCLLLPEDEFARYGMVHPLGGSALHSIVPTLSGEALAQAAASIKDEMVHDHVVHGTPDDVVTSIGAYSGLDHVRLSDLSSSGGGRGGGSERLLTIVSGLHALP